MILKIRKSPYKKLVNYKINLKDIKYIVPTGGSYYIKKTNNRSKEILENWFYLENLKWDYDEKKWDEINAYFLINQDEFINWLMTNFIRKIDYYNGYDFFFPILV